MENNFLQEYLKTGLFDIGDNDERLKWLKISIDDLRKKFDEDYSLLPKYVLVALDPNISDSEPVMIYTESIITAHWQALRVKFKEMPRNIIRGVILNAINSVGRAEPTAARIIYLASQSFYPYAKLGNEKHLVEAMITDLGEVVEKEALDEWSLAEEEPTLKLGVLKVTDFKLDSIEIDKEQLKAGLLVAVQNSPDGNGPQNGGTSSWGEHFATKSSQSITKAFNGAMAEFGTSLKPTSIETPINKFFADFKRTFDATLKSLISSSRAVERRSKLLWWKETLYSTSQKRSYRGLDKNLLPIVMSVDLNNQLPATTPASVEYLLRDTLFSLQGSQDEAIKFSDYISQISQTDIKAVLRPCFEEVPETDGRIGLTDFIALLVNDRVTVKEFQDRTGIDSKALINYGDLSVIILHDLLIRRLIRK